jgi:NAD/NADP transhydrogenase beta subunit
MTPQILQDFYDGKRSAAVPFVVNDEAIILRGVYAGKSGAVVSIDTSEASPRFLIEFGDGTDELVSLDNLEKYDDHVA